MIKISDAHIQISFQDSLFRKNMKTINQSSLLKLLPEIAMSMGILKTGYNPEGERIVSHMPIALYPYELTEETYARLVELHKIWQKLITEVASDEKMMAKMGKLVSQGDDFMENMVSIYLKSPKSQQFRVACTRIDYCGDESPQLVQFNLMSVGLNGISDRVQKLTQSTKYFYQDNQKYQIPNSSNQNSICDSLQLAIDKNNLKGGVVIMVVHKQQFNFGDQNAFKLAMIQRGTIVIDKTMDELLLGLKFQNDFELCYYEEQRVSAFYFRTGYKESHFPTKEHWALRENMQRSRTVKLPSIDMILVNTKRMQAELAKKEVLEGYLSHEETQKILAVSGEISDFDEMTSNELEELLMKMKDKNYVLKPNREGGGNNFFDSQAYEKVSLMKSNPTELRKYIVMRKIEMRKSANYFITNFKHTLFKHTTAEFSTFGSFVYQSGKIVENKCQGHLVRLKDAEDNEGGIAINKAAIAGLSLIKK